MICRWPCPWPLAINFGTVAPSFILGHTIDATIRCRYSLDRAIALCPPRDDSSSIFSGLGLRAMPPSRRFVAYPLGCAFALCPPRDDSSRQSSGPRHRAMSPSRDSSHFLWAAPSRYVPLATIRITDIDRAIALCPHRAIRHISSGLRHRAMFPSRRFESQIFSWPRLRAMPPLRQSVDILWAAPSRYVPLATIRRYPLGRACALCPPLAMIRWL